MFGRTATGVERGPGFGHIRAHRGELGGGEPARAAAKRRLSKLNGAAGVGHARRRLFPMGATGFPGFFEVAQGRGAMPGARALSRGGGTRGTGLRHDIPPEPTNLAYNGKGGRVNRKSRARSGRRAGRFAPRAPREFFAGGYGLHEGEWRYKLVERITE